MGNDKRKQPPTVSKAPIPIRPLRGVGSAPEVRLGPGRWDLWRLIPKCELWQAVSLSLDVEPTDEMARQLRRGRTEYSRLPEGFWDRLQVCQANVRMAGPIRPQELYLGAANSPYVPVLLSDVAGFLASVHLEMPSEMRGLMPTEPASFKGDMQTPPMTAQPTRQEGGRRKVQRLLTRRDDLTPTIDKARSMVNDPSDYAAVWGAFLGMATMDPPVKPLCGTLAGSVKYRTVEGFKSISRDAFIKRLKYADKRD